MIPRARFILHVDEFDATKGRIWMVKTRGLRINAHTVELHVLVTTVFKGKDARQPKAYLEGRGRVHVSGGRVIITA